MLKRSLTIATLLLFAGHAVAQNSTPAAEPTKTAQPAEAKKLSIGDPAPALEVEKFLKGEPITGFEKGRVYVVELWATWCGPCIQAMPHITKLQKQFKDNVTIVGVSVNETRNYTDATLTKVNNFVTKQGDRMGYTVAYDGAARKTAISYMEAAGVQGIPASFVIDQTGTIAWFGHPMWLDNVLPAVLAKTWDPKTDPAKIAAKKERVDAFFEKMNADPKAALNE
jgi:thiol-disulfide isomerase/thioredoxin